MCGIIGYIGRREVSPLLIDGLKRLEYRGYDSCGIAVLDDGTPQVLRSVGRVQKAQGLSVIGVIPPGAGTTPGSRWAPGEAARPTCP